MKLLDENVIFLSAQPDSRYFIWQLEMQIRNLRSFGISSDNIHILVSYDQNLGINKDFNRFIEDHQNFASFFVYPDFRQKPNYTSSIRPHVLNQHFTRHPDLSDEIIFYHDSDVLLTRLPQIKDTLIEPICYVSDTRKYLNSDYIIKNSSEHFLQTMLDVVGLSRSELAEKDENTGGAQYILRGVDAAFWSKVEKDSESLFVLIKEYNLKVWQENFERNPEFRSKRRGVQAWCADMWAVLWNLWYFGKRVLIHSELDFSWPYSPIRDWDRLAIQHYSGVIEKKEEFFKKTEYLNYPPWYDDSLNRIPRTNCSYRIVKVIKQRRRELDAARLKIRNGLVIIRANCVRKNDVEIFKIIRKYITKYLNVEVLFSQSPEPVTNEQKDAMIRSLRHQHPFKNVLLIPIRCMVDIPTIVKLLVKDDISEYSLCEFMPHYYYRVDTLLTEVFKKVLDEKMLYSNIGKLNPKQITNKDTVVVVGKSLIEKGSFRRRVNEYAIIGGHEVYCFEFS